ncbi:MAG: glycoside hydrolase family 3 [Desulfovibrionaceae bacterium]|nr:glycoside hydrolase family 3 [Desulfovibrionaceae bacterium]
MKIGLGLLQILALTCLLAPARATEADPEIMLGQMLMLGFRGERAGEGDLPLVMELIRQGRLGGVILFDRDSSSGGGPRNIRSREQLRALCAELNRVAPMPLFIAVDQEGGLVQRLKPAQGFRGLPSASEMGRLSAEEVFKLAAGQGLEMAEIGLNLNFAPVIDLDLNPKSPAIGALGRSFGVLTKDAARLGLAFMRGLNSAGVIACFKHFPGHGSAAQDTHLGLADISASWRPEELEPYRFLLAQPGAYAVMAGHLFQRGLDSRLPASLSPRIIDRLLRDDLGWQGVVFSDDLQMRAITEHYSLRETLRLGIQAGVDVFILGNNLDYRQGLAEEAWLTLMDLYRQGEIPQERLRRSFARIQDLKGQLNR